MRNTRFLTLALVAMLALTLNDSYSRSANAQASSSRYNLRSKPKALATYVNLCYYLARVKQT
jgi:hypothetical protein